MKAVLSRKQREYLGRARVARLGTVDSKHRPHLIPIVFATSKKGIYFAIDKKAKKGSDLKRLRNISKNSNTTVLIDNYEEDWSSLSFLMVHCTAKVLELNHNLKEKRTAEKLLKEKYLQYSAQGYFPKDLRKTIFVRLTPVRATFWQNRRSSVA